MSSCPTTGSRRTTDGSTLSRDKQARYRSRGGRPPSLRPTSDGYTGVPYAVTGVAAWVARVLDGTAARVTAHARIKTHASPVAPARTPKRRCHDQGDGQACPHGVFVPL